MTNERMSVKTTATINMLAGIWLFVSPWVYGAYHLLNAWNSWILGVLIVAFAATRFSKPFETRGASIVNLLLGIWVFASPWIFRYTGNEGRFINSLCVGVIVFVLAAIGSSMGRMETHHTPPPLHS